MFKKMMLLLNKKNRGFTLIELIVVIGILAILAALAIPAVSGYLENSKARTNVSNAKIIYNAAQAYLAAEPAAKPTDIADTEEDGIAEDNPIIEKGYLASVPKTAGNAVYKITGVDADPDDPDTKPSVTVTWEPETGVESETGTYPPAESETP